MTEKRCPLCNSTKCYRPSDSSSNAIAYACDTFCCSVIISSEIEEMQDYRKMLQLFNLIFEHTQKNRNSDNNHWNYYYDPNHLINDVDEADRINLAEIPYPRTLKEKADRSLMNLSRRISDYTDTIKGDTVFCRAIFADNIGEVERTGFFHILVDMGYLKEVVKEFYSITAQGWERIDELERNESAVKQGFIAMKFSNETKPIFSAIKEAISRSGYYPLRIDEKEHNNQIVPEIFYEIDRSKFLVMDATIPNLGAYYEAGYALGKEKPVIICCRKNEFESERPHYDIQQKAAIVWENEEELIERLRKRIEATVK